MAHKNNYIVLDCETGGLSADKNPITQFACIVLDPKTLKELHRFETFVQGYADLKHEAEALRFTGIKMQDIESGITVNELVTKLREISDEFKVGRMPHTRPLIVGHNVPFDITFIKKAFEIVSKHKYRKTYPEDVFFDTMQLSRLRWVDEFTPSDNLLNLKTCCDRADIELVNAHSAMGDVEATVQLFKYFIQSMKSGPNNQQGPTKTKTRQFFDL